MIKEERGNDTIIEKILELSKEKKLYGNIWMNTKICINI